MKWIKMEYETPRNLSEKFLFVNLRGVVDVGYYIYDFDSYTCSHWMPLPTPPTE